jgi:hypothetical protein
MMTREKQTQKQRLSGLALIHRVRKRLFPFFFYLFFLKKVQSFSDTLYYHHHRHHRHRCHCRSCALELVKLRIFHGRRRHNEAIFTSVLSAVEIKPCCVLQRKSEIHFAIL